MRCDAEREMGVERVKELREPPGTGPHDTHLVDGARQDPRWASRQGATGGL